MLLPLVSPPFTTAIAMIFSFGPRGLITYDLLGIKGFTVYGLWSTMFSEALTYFPIAYLTLRPILAAIDSNIEGISNRFIFSSEIGRTVSVHSRGITEALRKMYDGSRIADELQAR